MNNVNIIAAKLLKKEIATDVAQERESLIAFAQERKI